MVTPAFLAAASDEIMKLYADLEDAIKTDMCRRLASLGKISTSTDWQARILREAGSLGGDIDKYLTTYDKKTQKTVKELFRQLTTRSTSGEIAPNQQQMIAATQGYKGLITDLHNLTRTSTATTEFVIAANNLYMQVASGAFSYTEALKSTVDAMAAKGLYTLSYGERSYNIESMARTCVQTALGQTAGRQSMAEAEATDTDLVMVSAHEGARHTDKPANPWSNHDEWQGKVYCTTGEREYRDEDGNVHMALNLYEATGYGEVDGLCGINCRHTFYPYYEGEAERYDNAELADYRKADLTLDGKNVTRYEAEQELRKTERMIRGWKRKALCQQEAGLDDTAARMRLGAWQERRANICKQTGLRPDWTREYIGTPDGKQPRGIQPPTKSFITVKISGGSAGGILDKTTEEQEIYAKRAYTEIRNKDKESDIEKVAQNSGMPKEDVAKIRDHIFIDKHQLDKGLSRFDESPQIAHAWEALEQGRATDLDKMLLHHELEELTLMQKYGYTYEKAHLLANKKYPWEYKIKYDWTDDKIQKTIDKLLEQL